MISDRTATDLFVIFAAIYCLFCGYLLGWVCCLEAIRSGKWKMRK